MNRFYDFYINKVLVTFTLKSIKNLVVKRGQKRIWDIILSRRLHYPADF
jgi:hypothetical protein